MTYAKVMTYVVTFVGSCGMTLCVVMACQCDDSFGEAAMLIRCQTLNTCGCHVAHLRKCVFARFAPDVETRFLGRELWVLACWS